MTTTLNLQASESLSLGQLCAFIEKARQVGATDDSQITLCINLDLASESWLRIDIGDKPVVTTSSGSPVLPNRNTTSPRPSASGVAGYRPEQVANGVLPFGRTMIYRLMREGTLRSVRVGRARFIPADAIDEFLEQQTRKACPSAEAAS